MKPFLGIDLTVNKKNEQMNGEEFLIEKPALALTQSFENSLEETEETIEKSKLPLPIRICKWICAIIGLGIVFVTLELWAEEENFSIVQMYEKIPWIFWICGVCIVAWVILELIAVRRVNNIFESDEGSQVFDDFNTTCDAILSDLDVPSDAKEIDVLSFFYKVKGDSIKVCEKGLQIAPYSNPIFHIFADSENLYLTNLEGKYAIPLSEIRAINTVKKRILIEEWNKDESYNKGIYKQYKLVETEEGCIICKNYHILEFEHNNEQWGIYFPCYELPVIEELTGLKVAVL